MRGWTPGESSVSQFWASILRRCRVYCVEVRWNMGKAHTQNYVCRKPNDYRQGKLWLEAGFTIIEVMIVLAIAALLLLIIFLVVPKAQRNSRNYGRKHTVDVIAAQLVQYSTDHDGQLPKTVAEGNAFISGYASEASGYYNVQFYDNTHSHNFIPAYDGIAIQYGHWCASHGNLDAPGDYIASAPGGDQDNRFYVVWTKLENNIEYCVDNG